jgi:hypothetical protein
VATDNVYSALIGVLSANTAISSQLATYNGTSFPIIKAGVLSEVESGLPCITIQMESMGELNTTYGDENFILLVSALDEITSTKIARTIITELDDTLKSQDSFSLRLTCSGLGSKVTPTAKEISTPVTMRVVYRRD